MLTMCSVLYTQACPHVSYSVLAHLLLPIQFPSHRLSEITFVNTPLPILVACWSATNQVCYVKGAVSYSVPAHLLFTLPFFLLQVHNPPPDNSAFFFFDCTNRCHIALLRKRACIIFLACPPAFAHAIFFSSVV